MLKIGPHDTLPKPKRRAFAHIPEPVWAGINTVVFHIQSSTEPHITYEVVVVQVGDDLYVHCSCPHGRWAEERGDSCKHVRAVLEHWVRNVTDEERRLGMVV